jgi:fluoroacetyl-CoA thioesterase
LNPARVVRVGSIPVGAKGSATLLVGPEHLASRLKDAALPPVLATPVLIMVMETAALEAIRPFLGPGESAVGTAVDVRHLAATPLGQRVLGTAEVTRVDGRRIEFKVSAADEREEIGLGTHQRILIDVASFSQRLEAKRREPAAGARRLETDRRPPEPRR